MHTKRDAELNSDGAGEMQTTQVPLHGSDSCATSAHKDGEKQNPPSTPFFTANLHWTASIPTVFLYFGW